MAYLQHTSWKDRPGAVAGVIAIHAALGYGLINGLSFAGAIPDKMPDLRSTFVPEIPLPSPPPPEPQVESKSEMIPERKPVAPLPPLDLSDRSPPVDTTPIILPPLPDLPRVVPTPGPSSEPALKRPSSDPVGARPRNDPRAWVTTADYRSSWINREMTGVARFQLVVGMGGRVQSCRITASSGHPELDMATCDLVTRRARFEPARNGEGETTGGTYSSAVSWDLPR